MDRKNLINRLVNRSMSSANKGKAGCVPCFGRNLCMVRSVCFAGVQQAAQSNAKK